MRIRFSYIILLVLLPGIAGAQVVTGNALPEGSKLLPAGVEWFSPGFSDNEINDLVERSRANRGVLEFAVTREVDLNPDNSGYTVNSNGHSVWLLPVYSQGAASLNIIFSSFILAEEEYVIISNPSTGEYLGPFTSLNNKESGILPVMPLAGSRLLIEYHFKSPGQGIIEVGTIGHDVLGVFGERDEKDIYFNSSGPCNIDIVCPLGESWQDQSRAVFRILAGGAYLGTGFMVNNTNQENIPYAITASHVVKNATFAQNTIAIFAYQSPWCDGPDGKVTLSVSGAELISYNAEIDLSLLKLSLFPPITYRPYLAGWDVSGATPQTGTAIHHPSGDVKKISVDNDPPVKGTFQELVTNGFWKVLQWDYGTTEGGSSGSPLFNESGRVVGYLSGGEAMCGNSINDYFARMDIAWNLSPDMFKSLKPWLDPALAGSPVLDGRDPYAPNYLDADTLFNGNPDIRSLYKYTTPSIGYSTGINSDSILAYAERFYTAETVDITELWLYVGKRGYLLPSDSVTVAIAGDNGGPGNVIKQTRVLIKESLDSMMVKVIFREPVTVSGTFYVTYRNWYSRPADFAQSQYALYYEANQPPGSSFAWFRDQSGWHEFTSHPSDPVEASLWIAAVTVKSSVLNSSEEIKGEQPAPVIYPNPFSDSFSISVPETFGSVIMLSLYDLHGRKVLERHLVPGGETEVKTGSIKPGVYFVRISDGTHLMVSRLIKTGSR